MKINNIYINPENQNQPKFIESQRGSKILVDENYCIYHCNIKYQDKWLWRCFEYRKKICKVSVYTALEVPLIQKTIGVHIHICNPSIPKSYDF